ncbi:allophanate hydrolase [Mangrovactinospora gilvigrisea]|uniref:Allophanate hydrolase n=1 Tax=Mangrovactinospora gilvigrisea TaxID=1428644 RepID=A0A1J7BAL7_9ACTN|nr:allophanate hydrolase subunit 1 [Mangrovactinospora gilvigrisea]OIV35645.1 allophanate hydrolase [Mangrovactinospora gilvigrisea]
MSAAGTAVLRVHRVGHTALLAEAPDAAATAALHAELLRRREAGALPPLADIVPGATTVLLDGFTSAKERDGLAAELPAWQLPPARAADTPALTVPVRYDGPDLAEVAERWGCAPDEVGALHASFAYRVDFCGFAPGFGYLTGLPERYQLPRRPTPRTRVPTGAVALAGPYTGVYPQPSPGGWQLIGTTPLRLFDPGRDPAALLVPGTRVTFEPVDGGAA